MSAQMRALLVAALLTMAQAQGVILRAQGPGGPASPGMSVNRNQADANIINKNEIGSNVVNECGRTILQGNIDIGEETENHLGNQTVTKVTAGATVDVIVAQVNVDGAGPYTCDLDLTSNSNGASGQTKLTVLESKPHNGLITLKVQMPTDMACVGASTGDVCTVRCFNNNAKGPFGGCFAVQQTDITPKQNTPANIPTAATLQGVLSQVQQDIVDFPAAVKSNQEAATTGEQGLTAVKELLSNSTQVAAGPAAAAVNAAKGKTNNAGSANAGNANAGNANAGRTRAKAKGKGAAGLTALLNGAGGGAGTRQNPQQANNKRAPEQLLSSRLARRNINGRVN
ncbi:hypothetical protein LX32DRAFT_717009 [Colletotrichum zoysiae]|uniref:GEgh16 protein n=1 Tax=Colletotrichum zoysiae TaxID=1216348 RepID=A0AAD9HJY3_9PEZI|nr:hypothetical protein LX32DRAFT_717009 [Colletotrichum zoysiae]